MIFSDSARRVIVIQISGSDVDLRKMSSAPQLLHLIIVVLDARC